MSALDVEYYRRRLEEERKQTAEAADAKIAALHEELAILYEKMIDALEAPTSEAA